MSQESKILSHLERGRSITPLEALEKFGCWRLSARILSLRRDGYNIITIPIVTPSHKRIACYRLIK